MLRLIGLAVSIGLADSLNPSTVGPALYLAAGERPRRSVLVFAAAVFVVSLLGGAILTFGPGEAILALVPHPGHTVRYVAETVVGVGMLLGSMFLWRNRNRLGNRNASSEPRKSRSPAILGATIAGVELPTAFPYFAVVFAIVASGLGTGAKLVLLALYNLCFVLPLLVIALTLALAGERAKLLLERARAYLSRHWPVLLAGLALVAGLFVTLLGVTGLASGTHGRIGRISRRLRHVISH